MAKTIVERRGLSIARDAIALVACTRKYEAVALGKALRAPLLRFGPAAVGLRAANPLMDVTRSILGTCGES